MLDLHCSQPIAGMSRPRSSSYSGTSDRNKLRPQAHGQPPAQQRTASSNNIKDLEQLGHLSPTRSPASSVANFTSHRDDLSIPYSDDHGESGGGIQASDNSPDTRDDCVMQHAAVPPLPQTLASIPEQLHHVVVSPQSPTRSVTTLSDVKSDTVSVKDMVTLNSQRTEPNDTIPNLAVEPTSPESSISSDPYGPPMPCVSEMNCSDSIVI